jgi:hypothetical protein
MTDEADYSADYNFRIDNNPLNYYSSIGNEHENKHVFQGEWIHLD